MKIGYFITHFPYKDHFNDENHFKRYTHAGTEEVAYNLAINVAKKGHEVNIFTTSINSEDAIEKYENMSIYRYGTNFRIGSGNISFNFFRKPLKYQVDVVHAHHSIPIGALAALQYTKKKKIPFIVTYHGDAQENYGGFVRRMSVSFYNRYLLDKVLSYADVIISPSEFYINESSFLGKYRDKIVVIPNGINIEDFDIPCTKEECRERLELSIDSNIILFVGSLTPYKGPDILVRAMPNIIKEIPDTKLIFVGSGKMRSELDELTKKLNVKDYVKFAGFVGNTFEKALYYRSADIFVLPTMIEVFPIVLLEASASGLPMVVSDLNTFKCIIEEGCNGVFTKRRDKKSLADMIIHLLENEEVRSEMGKNARKKVEDYSWERIAEITEKVYNEVIS
jgi:glycosyltransferase involved in cell wall biosynthesis